MQGRFDEARDLFQRGDEVMEELRMGTLGNVYEVSVRGRVAMLAGDLSATERATRAGARELRPR